MYYEIQYYCIGNIVRDRKLTFNNKEYMVNLHLFHGFFSVYKQCMFSCNIRKRQLVNLILIDFSLTVKVVTLIFISGRGSAISSVKKGKSGSINNLVKNY